MSGNPFGHQVFPSVFPSACDAQCLAAKTLGLRDFAPLVNLGSYLFMANGRGSMSEKVGVKVSLMNLASTGWSTMIKLLDGRSDSITMYCFSGMLLASTRTVLATLNSLLPNV